MSEVICARLVGGAGTGKTAAALEILEKAMDRPEVGRNPFALGFSSFTRAARSEAAERAGLAWGIAPSELMRDGWFRTAHSIAHRAIGVRKGQVCDNDLEWLAKALDADLSYTGDEDEDGEEFKTYRGKRLEDESAAAALNLWAYARNTMSSLKDCADAVANFNPLICTDDVMSKIARYESAKRLEDRLDFTDMLCRFSGVAFDPIHGPVERRPEGDVPHDVVGWIFDEAQDASALLDRACRRIVTGDAVRWVWLMGDPFQVLFSFGGADSRHFMSWPVKHQKVMPRSYRCGAEVLALGERCLKPLPDYWDRGIAPADHESSVVEVDEYVDAIGEIDPRRETLVLARTNWQLKAMTTAMDEAGVPYRKVKSPQHGPRNFDRGCAALYSLQQDRSIHADDWIAAMDLLPAGGTSRADRYIPWGAKVAFEQAAKNGEIDVVSRGRLRGKWISENLTCIIEQGGWPSLVKGGQRWMRAVERWGLEVMAAPKVRVGTIHATKGQEADEVVLLTTTGQKVAKASEDSHAQWCEERRIEYVAVTRTRRRLIITHDPRQQKYRMELPL